MTCSNCYGALDGAADWRWAARRFVPEDVNAVLARGQLCVPCQAWLSGLSGQPSRRCVRCGQDRPASQYVKEGEPRLIERPLRPFEDAVPYTDAVVMPPGTCDRCARGFEIMAKTRRM